MIRLRPATPADLPLLRHWDEQPHVIAGGVEGWVWEEELGRDVDWREQLIAELDGRPVGYVEIIDPAREEDHYWGDVPEGLRALDIWIGEAEDLGKGYGTEMMRQALDRCFADPSVTAVLVDPLASNVRAHRFYERLGFRFVEERYFEDDDCFVYRLDRDAALSEWWPEFGVLLHALRRSEDPAVAERLVEVVRAGSTSGEILGGVGLVLRETRDLRRRLDASGRAAWDAVADEVSRVRR